MLVLCLESSAHVKEDNFNIANKSKLKGSHPIPGVEHAAFKTSKLGKLGEGVHQSNSGLQKGKQKSLSFKVRTDNTFPTNSFSFALLVLPHMVHLAMAGIDDHV